MLQFSYFAKDLHKTCSGNKILANENYFSYGRLTDKWHIINYKNTKNYILFFNQWFSTNGLQQTSKYIILESGKTIKINLKIILIHPLNSLLFFKVLNPGCTRKTNFKSAFSRSGKLIKFNNILYGTDIVWLASLRNHYSLKSYRLGKICNFSPLNIFSDLLLQSLEPNPSERTTTKYPICTWPFLQNQIQCNC